MTQETSSKKIQLSTQKLKELGSQLTDIMGRLEMTNHAIEGLELARRKDRDTFILLSGKFLNTAFEQNQKLYALLDNIAFYLLECDNAKELEAYAKSKMEG
ncbi:MULTISPECIES: hypothetical protein [unclassified Streptococcus]|uniref:hypothetical protein n=1 Tax=unclassified Streptococcus TaxID=2608887 RepID=UPI00359E7818